MSLRKKTFLWGARFGFTLILLFLSFYLLPISKDVLSSPPCCTWPTPAHPQCSPWVTCPSVPTSTPVPEPSPSTSPCQPTSTPGSPSPPTAAPTVESTPTGGQVATPTPTSTLSGGGGGPASPCTPPEAPKTPELLSAVAISSTEVRLTWKKVDRADHYAVVYGFSSHHYLYGNPNVGNTDSYVVGGLKPETNYFFVISAAIGGNCPVASPYSNEMSNRAGVGGNILGAIAGDPKDPPASEGELGGGISTEAGAVAGAKTQGACPFWWIALLAQAIVLGGFYGWILRKHKVPRFWWLVAGILVLIAYLVDRYAHTHWYVPSRMCPWEIWLGIGLAGLETVGYRLFRKNA